MSDTSGSNDEYRLRKVSVSDILAEEALQKVSESASQFQVIQFKPPPIRFHKLYKFARLSDYFLLSTSIFLSVLTGLSAPANTYLFGNLTDSLIAFQFGKEEEFLVEIDKFALGNAVIGLLIMVLSYLSIVLYNISVKRQLYRIRLKYFQSALRQNIGWYDINHTGDFASRMIEDINKLEDGVSEKVLQVIHSSSAFASCIILSLIKGWELALIGYSSLPLIMAFIKLVTFLASKLSKSEVESYSQAARVAEEVLSAIRTVVAFNGEKKECERYEKHLAVAKKNNIRRSLFNGIIFGILWFLIYLTYGISFWFGVKFVLDGRYTAGEMTTVFLSVMVGSMNFLIVVPYIPTFTAARVSAAMVFWVIRRISPIDPAAEVGKKPETIEGYIEFKNVSFTYPSRPQVPVLDDVSLKIRKGETVAFVGSSGCGKSTCIQLIQRFYDPTSGQVLIDGEDIRDLNLRTVRSHMGVVGQEPVLFATTIKQNIRFGKEDATDEEIKAASEVANANHFINRLPHGYDTLIGERGAQLSGGQKQRIAIARAVVRNPAILLLDEATSALDNESEAKVQKALDKASKGRTTIIVAHRLSTIRHADKIVVFSKGQVVEEGTHDELYNKRDHYYELVTAQATVMETVADEVSADPNITKISEEGISAPEPSPLYVQPEEPKPESAEKEDASFIKVLQMSRPEWKFNLLGTLASVAMGFCPPLFTIIFTDILGVFIIPDREEALDETKRYCFWFVFIGSLMALGTFFQVLTYGISGEKLTMRLRAQTFAAMLKQEMAWYDNRANSVGALCTRLSGDASNVQGATGQPIGAFVQAIATLGLSIGFSVYFQWKLGLVSLALSPLLLVGTFFMFRTIRGDSKKRHKLLETSSKIAIEAIANIRTVASLGRETALYKEYEKELKPANKALRKLTHVSAVTMGASRSLMFLSYALCMFYGGRLMAYEKEDYTSVLKVTQLLIMASFSIGNSFFFAPNFQKGLLSARQLYIFLKREPKIQDPDKSVADQYWSADGDVTYKEVSFRYPSRPDDQILRSLSLKIARGQTVALVGPSGCGKSTLMQLLERFYEAEKGEVKVDEYNVKDLKLHVLRKQLGIVSQEPVLFHKTIAENIAYGDNDRDVPIGEIVDAAQQANIHTFISNLPLGYETHLGEKGTQLSGGQKQRVAIARALIRKPKILLLDEATSALDTQSEKVVQEALDKAGVGRTCITIAHRLTTIVDADLIVVMTHGTIAEMGTHSELMSKKGIYRQLHTLHRK